LSILRRCGPISLLLKLASEAHPSRPGHAVGGWRSGSPHLAPLCAIDGRSGSILKYFHGSDIIEVDKVHRVCCFAFGCLRAISHHRPRTRGYWWCLIELKPRMRTLVCPPGAARVGVDLHACDPARKGFVDRHGSRPFCRVVAFTTPTAPVRSDFFCTP